MSGRVEMRDGLLAMFQSGITAVKVEAQEAALEAGIAGLDTARFTIDTTPSALSRKPKNNRNWTFQMRQDLDSKVSIAGTQITVRVGWLNRTEDYYLLQEYGGSLRSRDIPPMMALAKAEAVMLRTLSKRNIKPAGGAIA